MGSPLSFWELAEEVFIILVVVFALGFGIGELTFKAEKWWGRRKQ